MPAVRRVDYVQVGQRGKRAIFAPRGHDVPGWSAVRFVPNDDRAQQFALIYLPDDVAIPGSTKLCDTLEDRESTALRSAIEQLAGKTVETLRSMEVRGGRLQERSQTQAADLVASMFFGGPWNPIEPTSKGEYELLWAGQKVWSRPAIRGGASATDNFNRSNETPLSGGGNWDAGYADWANINLSSNAILASATGADSAARWLGNTFSGFGQYSQVDTTTTTNTQYSGAAVRMHPSSTTDESAYFGYQVIDFGNSGYDIWETSSAFGFTQLTHVTSGHSTAAATFRMEADGSSLALKRNGTNVSTTTDSTLSEATYTRVGVAQYRDLANNPIDNWEGGDLNPPVGGTVRRYTLSTLGVG